jgi:hypothetical protein
VVSRELGIIALLMHLQPVLSTAGIAWECRSEQLILPALPETQHMRSNWGQDIWLYETRGANVFGFPALRLQRTVFDDDQRQVRSIGYSAIVVGTVEEVRGQLLTANRDLVCQAAGTNYWCDDPTKAQHYGEREVFIGVAESGTTINCTWEERRR